MKHFIPALISVILVLAGCASSSHPAVQEISYRQISQEEAKQMMDQLDEAVILDVREQNEFDSGHIPGAILLPVGTITEDSAATVIPGKDTTVLVYCRSGNRSKTASDALVKLGYTQVYEFGGINTWPYDVE